MGKQFDYCAIPYIRENPNPAHGFLPGLEGVLQTAFRSENSFIDDRYFKKGNPQYPKHLEFVVGATRPTKTEQYVGALIATLERVGDTEFIYYDKIGVAPPYHNNGVMGNMLTLAKDAAAQRGIRIAALRTSIPKAHERYLGKSDITVQVGEYHIHGFGFVDKVIGQEFFEGARAKFDEIARYITGLPSTTKKLTQVQ